VILAVPTPGTHYNYKDAPDELVQRAGRIKAVCERHGVSQKAAAIQFPLGHPAVQTVLTGCRSVDELNETVEAFQAPIPPAAWDELKADGLLVADAPVPSWWSVPTTISDIPPTGSIPGRGISGR